MMCYSMNKTKNLAERKVQRIGLNFLNKFSEKIIVTWTLTSQNGFEIGSIKQENIVGKVRLDNNWAEISNQIVRGAIDGILDLVQAYSASKRQSKNKVE